MYFHRIVTNSLLQFSYLVGDSGEAFVIDPRRDIDIYCRLAAENNLRITSIFETHRNEDLLSGSAKLSEETGANVYRSAYEDPGYTYGTPIGEDESFSFGSLTLRPLHTPGHTLGHLSYVLERANRPYMVFTGDSLFYGGVGRTDFYGRDNLEKMTGLLYDSLFTKIQPLGDGVLIMPAHGAGSACGDDLDDLPLLSIGQAFSDTQSLPPDKETFIRKHGTMRHKNPAFETMEVRNLVPGGITKSPFPPILTEIPEDVKVIDLRDRFSYCAAHLPGSLYVPGELVPSYLGWFVGTDEAIAVIADGVGRDVLEGALDSMRRQGFDRIRGIIAEGTLTGRINQDQPVAQLGMLFADAYRSKDFVTLDVRKKEELKPDDPVTGRVHIPLQELKERIEQVPKHGPLVVLCRSGERSTVAASYLASMGYTNLSVLQGGILALQNTSD